MKNRPQKRKQSIKEILTHKDLTEKKGANFQPAAFFCVASGKDNHGVCCFFGMISSFFALKTTSLHSKHVLAISHKTNDHYIAYNMQQKQAVARKRRKKRKVPKVLPCEMFFFFEC